MNNVIIIGGGIAGLTAAWKLQREGLDVRVLEAQPSAGGHVRTLDHQGFRLEAGPSSFMGSSENIWTLLSDLGIEGLVEPASPASNHRYVVRDGRLRAIPTGIGSFLTTRLLSARGKARLAIEPFVRNGARDTDTAWDFFVRRFGVEAATFLMGPFVSGIYAGDARLLGARSAFPKFWGWEKESGSMIRGAIQYLAAKRLAAKRRAAKRRAAKRAEKSGTAENSDSAGDSGAGAAPATRKGLFSMDGGLGRITERLAADLGDRVIPGSEVAAIEFRNGLYEVRTRAGALFAAHSIVSAVPPHVAARLLGKTSPGIVSPLEAIPMAPVTLVHWDQPADLPGWPAGFGFLVPRIYEYRVLGTIFLSQLFRSRAPRGRMLLSSFYGGMLDAPPGVGALSDGEIEKLVLSEHAAITCAGVASPSMLKILRYPGAIPQLLVDHADRMALVEAEMARNPGVFLAGNYLTGVGVEHAVRSGYEAYRKAAMFLRQRAAA